jgi:hypothetical protein
MTKGDFRRVAWLAVAGTLAAGAMGTAGGEGPPPGPTAEVLRERLVRAEAEAALRDGFEKMCLEEGKHWDDQRRECIYLMRSKD